MFGAGNDSGTPGDGLPFDDPGEVSPVDASIPWDVTQEIASYYDAIDLSNYANVVYINPDTTVPEGEQDGSIEKPFNSWRDVEMAANSAYLQKRGTVAEHSGNLDVGEQDNVLIWVYGDGEERAVFKGEISFGNSKDNILADFEFDGDGLGQNGTNGFSYSKSKERVAPDDENLLFLNNYIHGTGGIGISNWGDATCGTCEPHGPIRGVKIIGNEIGPVWGDGMFIGPTESYPIPPDSDSSIDNMEIGFNNVHGVNYEWHAFEAAMVENGGPFVCAIEGEEYIFPYCPEGHEPGTGDCYADNQIPYVCGGDAYQIADMDNFWFHDNIGDRRATGNKFVALFGSVLSNWPGDALIERNIFVGPSAEGRGGTGLYIVHRRAGSSVVIRNNLFLPPHAASLTVKNMHPDNLEIYGNAISGGETGLIISEDYDDTYNNIDLFNNVFYHVRDGDLIFLVSDTVTGSFANNIFAYPEGGKSYGSILNFPAPLLASNNLFSSTYDGIAYQPKSSDIIADPLFVDPEGGDFHLQSGSPAIDAGTAIGLPAGMKDIDGEDVSAGEAPEIGIDEVE